MLLDGGSGDTKAAYILARKGWVAPVLFERYTSLQSWKVRASLSCPDNQTDNGPRGGIHSCLFFLSTLRLGFSNLQNY